jgi:xanthine dehydrogenase accessory factor
VPQDQLDRVRVPAGLDLGRTTHMEIAVAILAELVQFRAARSVSGPVVAEQLVDPVCGMTVSTASPSLDLDGVTYYFCSAGCRDAFEKREARC